MANKIGVVLALDGEQKFSQGMKEAQKSAKLLDTELKGLSNEYKGQQNSLQALSAKQEVLNKKQEAYNRVLDNAKRGQDAAVKNYEKEKKALDDLTKEREKAEKALEKMSKDDSGYDSQVKAVEELKDKIEKQEDAYVKAGTKLASWDKKVNTASKNVKNNSEAIEKNAKYLDEASHSADKVATSIDAMGKEMKQTEKEGEKLGSGLKDAFAVAAGNLAANAVTALGNAAKEAAKYVVDVGSEYEATMSEVEAISGASAEDMKQMEEMSKQLGRTTKFSAKDVGAAFKYMSLAGWQTADMLSAINGVTDLAAASGMDLAQASDMLTDYLSAFGMEASEAVKMADMLTFAQANSNTSVEQLGEAYANSAANMHAAGQDIETTTALLEAMANQGDKGSTAGTGLAAVMADIGKKAKDGAIQIGETKVQVMDMNGNYRDLSDIMRDVENATEGMGTAERDAALKATFQKKSLQAVNEILTEGMDAIDGYEEALRNSEGAAKDMANTMQANLKGAMANFGSAVDGLATEAYGYIAGPATTIVQGAADAINGLTDAITPHKTAMDEFIESIELANEETAKSIENATATIDDAETDVANIQALADIIKAANDEFTIFVGTDTSAVATDAETTAEGITTAFGDIKTVTEEAIDTAADSVGNLDDKMASFDFFKAKGAIEQLAKVIPEIGEAWDPVNGTLDMTVQEFDKLIDVQKALAIQTAVTKAQGELLDAVAQSAVNESMAKSALEKSLEALNEKMGTDFKDADLALTYFNEHWNELEFDSVEEIVDLGQNVEDANNAFKESAQITKDAEQEYESTGEVLQDLYNEYGVVAEAGEEVNEVIEGTGDAASETADEVQEVSKKLKDLADVAKDSATNVKEAWNGMVETAKSSIGEIDLSQAFNGGDVTSTSEMLNNLESQIDGLNNYSDNLEKLASHIGKEVTPEFFQYIQDMGVGGAANLENLLKALETEDGAERVAQISQEYVDALNLKDEIAVQMTANSVALANGMNNFGSTNTEFNGLKKAIDSGLDDADADMRSKIAELVETAQTVGATIPEGLTEAISSNEVSSGEVEDQLNAAIEGAISSWADIVEENGGTIPDGLIESIQNGEADVQDAFKTLLESLGDVSSEMENNPVTDTLISSMEDSQDEVNESAVTLAEGAASAMTEDTTAFSDAGTAWTESVASGVKSGQSNIATAASDAAQAAKSAMSAWETQFNSVGQNMVSGVANGISSNKSLAIIAATTMAKNALQAAKDALVIRSPSRKFRDEVGKQIGAGMAFGIKQSSKLAENAAENLAGRTLYAAKKWVSKNGKKEAEGFAYTWEKLLSYELKKSKKNGKNTISGAFGISWYTKDGKKTVKKDAETYYGEVVSAAENYFDNINALYTMNEHEQLKYWEKVAKTVKKGTQAYYKVQETIKGIKENIGSFDVASDVLSSFRDFYDLSLTDELHYWQEVMKNYKKGSDDYIQAQNEVLKVEKKIAEQRKAIQDRFNKAMEEAAKRQQDAINDLKDTYSGAFDLFDEFLSESQTGEELLYNMKTQAEGYKFWEQQIADLAARGVLSQDLMDEIIAKGPNDAAALYALNTLSDDQLKEFQQAWNEKQAVAQRQAEKDRQIQQQYQEDVKTAEQEQKDALDELESVTSTGFADIATTIKTTAKTEVDRIVNAIVTGKDSGSTAGSSGSGSAGSGTSSSGSSTSSSSTNSTNKVSKANKNKIKELLNGEPKRSKKLTDKEKDRGTLWKYLVTEYGIDGDQELYKKLAKLLGVTVSDTVTNSQKKAILAAFKAAGFSSGTRKLDDFFAWMDEEGIGSEMIIRQSDGARLNTNVRPGDAIVSAANTQNLWDWSEIAPKDLLATMAAQNALIQTYIASMTRGINVNAMNDSLYVGASGGGYMSGTSNGMLGQMVELMSSYLPYLAERTSISVDGRRLVSATSDYTSNDFAMRQKRKRGGGRR